MRTPPILLPYVLIGFGVLYLLKPDVFHLLVSRLKPVSERRAMTEGNRGFMRMLGTMFVIAGVAILMYGHR